MKTIKLFDKQMEFLKSNARFSLALGGWQSGKTTVGAVTLLKRIDEDTVKWYENGKLKENKPKYWVVAPTQEILSSATMTKLLEVMPDNIATYSKNNNTVKLLKSGVEIIGKSAYNPSTIEAVTLNGIWGDEAGLYSREIWTKLRPRINIRSGFIIFTTTPYDLSWLYDEIYLKFLDGDKDFNVTSWSSIDNPYFDKSEYVKEKKRLTNEEFEMKYGGRFTKLTGLIYNWQPSECLIPHKDIPIKYDVIIIGLDFGVYSPHGIVVVGVVDGIYYVLSESKRKNVEKYELGIILSNLKQQYNIRSIFADPEDPKTIKYLRTIGLPVYKADNKVQDGISSVREALVSKHLFVDERCVEITKEFQMYSRKMDKEGIYTEKPAKNIFHLLDALRYALNTFKYNPIDKLYRTVLNENNSLLVNKIQSRPEIDYSQYTIPEQMYRLHELTYGETWDETVLRQENDLYLDF